MIKYYIILNFILTISNFAYCQNKVDSLVITKTINNVIFISNDTLYKFTKIVQQDGVFLFTEDPIDSVYLRNNQVYKSYFPDKIRYTKIIYNYLHEIDTIFNYFSNDYKHNINEELFFEELRYSYILTQLRESKLSDVGDDIIRIIWPCDEMNICNIYKIVRFDINEHGIILHTVTGTSDDFKGIKPSNRDSCYIKNKDVKKIFKIIGKIKSLTDDFCINPIAGNPWLLESKIGNNQNLAILLNLCLRHRSQKSAYINILKKLNIIAVKYVPYDCKRPAQLLEFY